MDLQQQQQQQMFLNAWIRPTLLSPTPTNTTTITQQQQNILQNIPEHLRGNSSSSSSLIIRPPQPQQHQQLVIRHVPPSIRVFEPSMSSPSLTSSSSSSSSIPFSSSPSLNNSNNLNPLLLNLHQQQISSPISTKILQIPSQQPQQYPPQQFDQLVALAHFQQMLERIKASETAKASQLLENNSQNFGLIPTSAFKLVNNSLQNSELTTINKTSTPCFLSEETVLQQRQLEPKQQKIELKHQQQTSQQQKQQQRSPSSSLQKNFTPTPSTSADELLGQAIIKLLQQQQQTKGEITEINGNNNIQTNIEGSNTNQTNPDYSTIIAGEEVLLCKVCSDRASGFHYGIFSCEGCKGFFRRSLQNKIDYRPCTQSQKCQIVRANRNRCQECRWRKCIEAGMSKDGVRYGRVPKREKEKLREEMRRDSVRSVFEHLNFELSNEERLLEKLEKGWKELENDLRIILKRKEEENNNGEEEKIIDSNKLCLLAKAVVRFAENIGGFRLLRIDDQAQV
uniref:Nuclear receptor domain-containing protein n=1 Tax=Meloidogyne incognita TaxID=6306 RepID=A0A914N3I4_MELIC